MKHKGYRLVPGSVSKDKLFYLLKLANIKSTQKQLALIDYLVKGWPQSVCAVNYGLGQSTIADAVGQLNKRHEWACKMVEVDGAN